MSDFQRQTIDAERIPPHVLPKWSAAVLSEGYVPFPKKLLRCLHRCFGNSQSMKELAALLAVADFKRPNLTRKPSLAYLAFLSGLSEDELRSAIQRLAKRGYVTVAGTDAGLDVQMAGLLSAIESETEESS